MKIQILISCLVIFSAFLICCSRNIIFSIFIFISFIINLVFLLISYNIEFLSLIFLIIYIGAITVLFLFVIFIINLEENTIKLINKVNILNFVVLLLVSFFCLKVFFSIIVFLNIEINNLNLLIKFDLYYLDNINFFFSFYDIDLLGLILYTNYGFYLIFISFILLIAIIGSVLLVTNKLNK